MPHTNCQEQIRIVIKRNSHKQVLNPLKYAAAINTKVMHFTSITTGKKNNKFRRNCFETWNLQHLCVETKFLNFTNLT